MHLPLPSVSRAACPSPRALPLGVLGSRGMGPRGWGGQGAGWRVPAHPVAQTLTEHLARPSPRSLSLHPAPPHIQNPELSDPESSMGVNLPPGGRGDPGGTVLGLLGHWAAGPGIRTPVSRPVPRSQVP